MVADMREGSRDIFSQALDCVLVAILASVSIRVQRNGISVENGSVQAASSSPRYLGHEIRLF